MMSAAGLPCETPSTAAGPAGPNVEVPEGLKSDGLKSEGWKSDGLKSEMFIPEGFKSNGLDPTLDPRG